jgi:hypothetical protein
MKVFRQEPTATPLSIAMSIIPKAYLIGFVSTVIPYLLFAVRYSDIRLLLLRLWWSDLLLSGIWSIAGFLGFPYAFYKVLAFLPEQTELNGAAHCFNSGAMFSLGLNEELKILNPLLSGAIYLTFVGTVGIWNVRRGKPWIQTAQSWRLFTFAAISAICVIWAKDELAKAIGIHNFYCG